jgi:uncharacterized iron-regulated membrane protein
MDLIIQGILIGVGIIIAFRFFPLILAGLAVWGIGWCLIWGIGLIWAFSQPKWVDPSQQRQPAPASFDLINAPAPAPTPDPEAQKKIDQMMAYMDNFVKAKNR